VSVADVSLNIFLGIYIVIMVIFVFFMIVGHILSLFPHSRKDNNATKTSSTNSIHSPITIPDPSFSKKQKGNKATTGLNIRRRGAKTTVGFGSGTSTGRDPLGPTTTRKTGR
jgi:hypothetical protein